MLKTELIRRESVKQLPQTEDDKERVIINLKKTITNILDKKERSEQELRYKEV